MKLNKFDVQIARIRFRGLSFQQTVFQSSYTLKRLKFYLGEDYAFLGSACTLRIDESL